MMLPRLTRRDDPAVAETVPTQTPERRNGGDQTEADLAQTQPPRRVQHEHRPRGTEGDVEGEDRQHQGPDGA